MTPLDILRTILCANPTAEQILAALAANGFEIVPVGRVTATEQAIDDPIAFIQGIVERRGITTSELARAVGIAPSTLNKKVADPEAGGLNARTLKKIADWDRNGGALDDPKSYVQDVLQRHNLKPGALAEKVGIQPSTLTRALNDPDHKFKFSVGTLQKIREWDRSQ
jgi:predicted transcriptional regulator